MRSAPLTALRHHLTGETRATPGGRASDSSTDFDPVRQWARWDFGGWVLHFPPSVKLTNAQFGPHETGRNWPAAATQSVHTERRLDFRSLAAVNFDSDLSDRERTIGTHVYCQQGGASARSSWTVVPTLGRQHATAQCRRFEHLRGMTLIPPGGRRWSFRVARMPDGCGETWRSSTVKLLVKTYGGPSN